MLADMLRTDAHPLREVTADTPQAQGVKVGARAHKTLIWERARQADRLRPQLRDFFPAALEADGNLGLDSADVLELLARAPDPASAARLTTAQISAALKHAHRHDIAAKTPAIRAALRGPQLAVPARSPRPQRPWCGPGRGAHSPRPADHRCGRVRSITRISAALSVWS